MATAKLKESDSLVRQLLTTSPYKRNQGRVVRQATFFAIAGILVIGCITLGNTILSAQLTPIKVGVPTILAALGAWCAYRLVNFPRVADFLVSVEGELDKVSWPEWPYLWRALGVVLGVLVLFIAYMWFCDTIWVLLFRLIGFLNI